MNSSSVIIIGTNSQAQQGGISIGHNNSLSARSKFKSCAIGKNLTVSDSNRFVIGEYNNSQTGNFTVGDGSSDAKSNCFRVTHTGTYASGNYNASGADYAECFEWEDGNLDNEDRVGRFVTLEDEKIRLADETDDFILGIVSGDSSIIGDVYDNQWKRIYLFDVFGRPIFEDVQVPAVIEETEKNDDEGNKIIETVEIIPSYVERRQKLNPNYNSEEKYIPRSERPEWDAIGLLGKLVMVDDGTCKTNGWAKPGTGGMAAAPETITKFLVMSRIDESHIRVLIL